MGLISTTKRAYTKQVHSQISKTFMKLSLPKGNFARNITVLAGGTAMAQLMALVAIPLLSRLYTPEEFGILSIFVSILGVATVVSSLRYELAIPLPDSDDEAAATLVLSIIILVFMSLIFSALVFNMSEDLVGLLNAPDISGYLWLLPIGIFFSGLYNIFNYWAIRKKRFKAIAKTKLTQVILMLTVQLGAFGIGSLALLLGQVIARSGGVVSLSKFAIHHDLQSIKNTTSSAILAVMKKERRFPLYSTWAALINSIGSLAPNILFAIFYSPSAAGLFFMANKMMSIPMSLLGQAIGQAFYSEAAEKKRHGDLYEFAIQTSKRLAIFIVPPMLMIAAFGCEIIIMILGEEWRDTGLMTEWLSVMVASQFITSPISNIFSITNQQAKGLVLQANLTVLRIGAIIIAYMQKASIYEAVIYYSIFSAIGYFFYLILALKPSGSYQSND